MPALDLPSAEPGGTDAGLFVPPPESVFQVSGAVGDIYQLIMESARYPQKPFSLAGALVTVSAAAGRKYHLPDGSRSNLYAVSIGESGCGKEYIISAIKAILTAAGMGDRIAAEGIASGAAIEDCLVRNSVATFLIDEFGKFLSKLAEAGDADNGVLRTLLEVYSKSGGLYLGRARANIEPARIDNPIVSLYGSSTPLQLFRAMKMDLAEDGFLSRIMFFPSNELRPRRQSQKHIEKLPGSLQIFFREIQSSPDEVVVRLTDQAQMLFDAYLDSVDNQLREVYCPVNRALLVRRGESASRVMVLAAIGRGPNATVVDEQDVRFATTLADWSYDSCYESVNSTLLRTGGDKQYARLMSLVENPERFLGHRDAERHQAGLVDGIVPRRMIQQRMAIKAVELEQLIATAIGAGDLYVHREDHRADGKIIGYSAVPQIMDPRSLR